MQSGGGKNLVELSAEVLGGVNVWQKSLEGKLSHRGNVYGKNVCRRENVREKHLREMSTYPCRIKSRY